MDAPLCNDYLRPCPLVARYPSRRLSWGWGVLISMISMLDGQATRSPTMDRHVHGTRDQLFSWGFVRLTFARHGGTPTQVV